MLIKMKNKISKSTTRSQQFKLIGITGFFIILLCNIFGQVVFQTQDIAFFQTDWWSVWFPNYSVWISLVIVGFVIKNKEMTDETKLLELHSY